MVSLALLQPTNARQIAGQNVRELQFVGQGYNLNASQARIYFVVSRRHCRGRVRDSHHPVGLLVAETERFTGPVGAFHLPTARAHDRVIDHLRLSPHRPQA